MNIDQLLSQFAQALDRHRLTIDVTAGAAISVDGTADGTFTIHVHLSLYQPFLNVGKFTECKGGPDLGSCMAMPDHPAVSSISQREPQCTKQDRFTCTSLPTEDRHAGVEHQFHLFHEGEVTDMEMSQHPFTRYKSEFLRIIPSRAFHAGYGSGRGPQGGSCEYCAPCDGS